MPCKFIVGDTVCLNDTGIAQCFGSVVGLEAMKEKHYKITKVGAESLTEPEETYEVSVDDAALNKLMIDDRCFDLVRKRESIMDVPDQIDEARLKKAVEAGMDAFWEAVAKQYPEATSGDLAAGMEVAFNHVCAEVAKSWVENNVPKTVSKESEVYAW